MGGSIRGGLKAWPGVGGGVHGWIVSKRLKKEKLIAFGVILVGGMEELS